MTKISKVTILTIPMFGVERRGRADFAVRHLLAAGAVVTGLLMRDAGNMLAGSG
jgi:hypothetical protein